MDKEKSTLLTAGEISKFDSCLLWLELLRTEHTKKNFKLHLSLFCRFANTDPDTLLTWKDEQIRQKLIEYIIYIKKNAKRKAEKPKSGEISVNSIRTYLGGVQNYLSFHERLFNWKKLYSYLPEKVTTKLRAYSKDEIKRLLEFADQRDRAIILIMASGGPRRGAFPSMRVGDVSTIDDELGIGLLKVYPDSERDHYVTLLTPECMDAIRKYLEWRKQKGEKLSSDSPLIRDKFDIFSKRRNEPRPLQEEAIHAQVTRVIKLAGIDAENLAPDHSFRYFFNTAMMNSDVNQQFKELMMGHSINLDDYYFKADTRESRRKILTEYVKAVDALTINEEYRLKMELESLKGELEKAAPKDLVADLIIQNKTLAERQANMEKKAERSEEKMKLYEALLSDPKKLKKFLEQT